MPTDTDLSSSELMERALAECASEPIERPGAIQAFGMVWVFDDAGRILQHAGPESARRQIGSSEEGGIIDRVVSPRLATRVKQRMEGSRALAEGESRDLGWFERPLACSESIQTPREAILHRHAGRWLLELVETREDSEQEPCANPFYSAENGDEAIEDLVADLANLLTQENSREGVVQDAATRLRTALGYDRVMIYRFDPDWNGEVIAEARRPDQEPYLGLHYPASDIPPQARALYHRHKLRVLADVVAEPLPLVPALEPAVDLAPLLCRAISPVHRRYLINMGVRASLSVSIVVEGRLWGLIACHHDSPRVPSRATRRAVLIAADLIAGRIKLAETREVVDAFRRGQQLLRSLPKVLRIGSIAEWEQLLAGPEAGLVELLRADGFAVVRPNAVYTRGATPEANDLHALVNHLDQQGESLVVTDRLGEVAPEFTAHAGVAAGLLALKVPDHPHHWLLWFRGEFARAVTWAGDHRKGMTPTETGFRLEPRASFAAWIEVLRGRCRPWTAADRLIVSETIRDHVLDGIIQWRRLLGLRLKTLSEAIFAQIDDAVIAVDSQGTILVWNRHAERLLGQSEADAVGRRLDDPFLAIDPLVIDRWRVTRDQNGSIAAERWLECRQGRLFIEERWRSVEDEQGEPLFVLAVLHDATVRKTTLEELQASRKRFEAFMSHLPAAAWIERDDTGFEFRNQRFWLDREITPDSSESQVLRLAGLREQDRVSSQRVFETGETVSLIEPFPREDGSLGESLVIKFPILNGSDHKLLGGLAIDVTERNQMERDLREREERYRLAVQNGRVAVWEYDFATDVFRPDQEFWNWLEISPDKAPRTLRDWFACHHEDDLETIRVAYERHLAGETEIAEFESRFVVSSGATLWFLSRGRVIRDAQGQPTRYFGTNIDITERKLIELRLRKTLRERETLLKELHHRVKNNLAVIVELLGLQIRRLGKVDGIAAQSLEESQSRIHSMAVVHELLHREEGGRNSLSVPDYLRRLCDLLTQRGSQDPSRIDLMVSAEPEELELDLDRAVPFGLILNELITNALKHAFSAGRGGRLEVVVRGRPGDHLLLSVSDDGPGAPEGLVWSASPSLGLRLIHSLTAQLDGAIRFVSRPGEGVTALLTFPLHTRTSTQPGEKGI